MLMRTLLVAVVALPLAVRAESKVDFNRDVRPILADNCFACHGPDDKARKADLKLHTREGALTTIDLKKPSESELIKRLTTTDKSERMPPAKTVSRTWPSGARPEKRHELHTAPRIRRARVGTTR